MRLMLVEAAAREWAVPASEIKAEKGFRLSTEALAEMYPDTALGKRFWAGLRGQAGEHQVEGARTALGHAYGGGSQFFAMWVVGAGKP